MRDLHGRWAVGGVEGRLPGLRAGGALRRERGEGDARSRRGVRRVRAVADRAAVVLGPLALGLMPAMSEAASTDGSFLVHDDAGGYQAFELSWKEFRPSMSSRRSASRDARTR